MKARARHHLRKDQEKKILDSLQTRFGKEFADKIAMAKLELLETDESDVVLIDGEPLMFIFEDIPFLTVKGALKLNPARYTVTVDSGAVKFIAGGADVMAPGIVAADPAIVEGDYVIVKEETYGKALAIGRALMPAGSMVRGKGKAVKSLHRVGDELWKLAAD
ncbi:MAG TPA: RNA-binding protein [Candidatus Methanoperedenaceae archaeon]|nr:RNA-binding protein [Candidatus Methanoperedenaceae archaeon]